MSTDITSASVSRTVTVGSSVGLHARPAGAVVKLATAQPAVVTLSKGDKGPVDARSLLSLLSLGAEHGDEVTVAAEGEGAQESVDAVADLIATDQDA
ncbi:HPr family phosphocarrier protein [Euzebya sp.]|uniref:HPr family phosphocarrier protein n=1 Tax=Euzebya sp. TaxID=1971409 RepID=UPI0035178092